MQKKKYICRKCEHKFEKEVISREEALERKINLTPVRCPNCGATDVEKI